MGMVDRNTDQALCNAMVYGMSAAVYVAISCNGRIAVTSPEWWELSPETLLVLQLLVKSVLPTASLAQIPVHLPDLAQQQPHHLLVATLITGELSWLSFLSHAAAVSPVSFSPCAPICHPSILSDAVLCSLLGPISLSVF